ncbi:MAG: VWA domain-containing protein [Planctomycetaceae bacterium]|nr:VWA domain-containing protein [Planctomycetaceae bacterium]
MTILNATALATALGVLVPIVIHLHRRRRAPVVQWSAMQFLTVSQASRRRGLALENLLLLFVRCCLVLLFALAMAQPVLPEGGSVRLFTFFVLTLGGLLGLSAALVRSFSLWGRLAGTVLAVLLLPAAYCQLSRSAEISAEPTSRCDLVIVLDETSSMQIERDGGVRFDQVVEQAQRLVDRLSGSSTVSIVRCGPVVETVTGSPFRNLRAASRALSELQPAGGGADMAAALDRARLLAEKGENACRQIVLFTDDQLTTWEAVEGSSLVAAGTTARAEASEQATDNQAVRVAVHLTRLPRDRQNVSVDDVRVESPLLSVGRQLMIVAELTNHGGQMAEGIQADLQIDGASVSTQSPLVIAPATTKTVRFPYAFPAAGQHTVSVHADVTDAMSDDDRCDTVVTVRAGLSVLLVNGNTTAKPGEQAALLMNLALDPAGGGQQPVDGKQPPAQRPIHVQRVAAETFRDQTSLAEFDIVLLCEVPQLPQRQAERLAEYVHDGGSLWILPDAHANARFYNDWTQSDSHAALLPAVLQDHQLRRGDDRALPSGIDLTTQSDLLSDLVEGGRHDLAQVQFAAWRQVAVRETAVAGMKLTSGDPLFVEQAAGQGRVLLQTAGPALSDGNLLHRISFPVMMHMWACHLATSQTRADQFQPAAELSVPLSPVISSFLEERGTKFLQLIDPSSTTQTVRVLNEGPRMLARVPGARQSGIYQLESSGDAALRQTFAVSRDARESDLSVAAHEKLLTLGQTCGLQWMTSADQLQFSAMAGPAVREIAPALLVCVLCLLAVESLLAFWVRRRRAFSPPQTLSLPTAFAPQPLIGGESGGSVSGGSVSGGSASPETLPDGTGSVATASAHLERRTETARVRRRRSQKNSRPTRLSQEHSAQPDGNTGGHLK